MKTICLRRLAVIFFITSLCFPALSAQTETTSCDTVRFTWQSRSPNTNYFYFAGTNGKDFVMDWGDSLQTTVTGSGSSKWVSHSYAAVGSYHVLLYGVDADARILQIKCATGNVLTSLDVSGCTALTSMENIVADTLRIHGESMATLTIKSTGVSSDSYRIGVLDAVGCTSLRQLTFTPYDRESSYYGIISSLKLQGCTSLQTVSCKHSQMTSLDVSGCTALTNLDCSTNQLIDLDVSGCTSLKSLNSYNNHKLSILDVSDCTSLTSLKCGTSGLMSLNVSGCTLLKTLECQYNKLDGLDVSGCTSLQELSYHNNPLTSLVASGCTSLTDLNCDISTLESVDASGCTSLPSLYCRISSLKSLDVSGCTALTYLFCSSNKLSSLNVSGCKSLTSLNNVDADTLKIHGESMATLTIKSGAISEYYRIGVLDAVGCTSLRELTLTPYENTTPLTTYYYGTVNNLKLRGCTALRSLSCKNNELTSLDVSGCTSLTSLSCSDNPLKSLDVSGCTSLRRLSFKSKYQCSLDLSGCTSLIDLSLYSRLSRLDLSGCTSLKSLRNVNADTLRIHGESMATLTIEGTDESSYSYSSYRIGVLDAVGCTSLRQLTFTPYYNKSSYYGTINSLMLQGCTSLQTVSCNNSQLTNLDVSGCTALTSLSCGGNQLNRLDVSKNTTLTSLSCSRNKLTSLDVSKNTFLKSLTCDSNQLSSLSVNGYKSLTNLSCTSNKLKSLDVSGCTSLKNLSCGNNPFTTLDVSGCTSLTSLTCASNKLKSLDVSGCVLLKELRSITADTLKVHGVSMDILDLYVEDGSGCQIKRLDANGCTSLKSLNCRSNGLISLDVSGCTSLTELSCSNNQLTSLDVSKNTSLENLSCDSNQLSNIDVSGCTSLVTLNCDRNQLSNIDVRGCTSLETLTCDRNQLSSLDMSGCTSLVTLNCDRNQLSSIDMSGCTSLVTLNCDSNQLSNIDVRGFTSLETLNCDNNRLSDLDVGGCTALTRLYCSNNQLQSLNVSGCSSLSNLMCENNRLPLSILYKAYSQVSQWQEFKCSSQSDSITLPINRPLDLSSERIIGQSLSTFTLTDAYGGNVASDFYTENRFAFSFYEPITYELRLNNKVIGKNGAEYTYYISVVDVPVQYFTVQVASNNAGWGSVSQTGSGTYEEGTEVTVSAAPNEGYRFVDWTGKDGTVFATESVHTFAVMEDVELTANFEKIPEEVETFKVSLSANNSAWGIVSLVGNEVCERGEEVTIIATPTTDFRFINWTKKDGTVFSTEAIYTFAVTEDIELTANFEQVLGNSDYATSDMRVYPNPNHGTFQLDLPEGALVEVFSETGTICYRKQLSAGISTLILPNSGLYFVKVNNLIKRVVVY